MTHGRTKIIDIKKTHSLEDFLVYHLEDLLTQNFYGLLTLAVLEILMEVFPENCNNKINLLTSTLLIF